MGQACDIYPANTRRWTNVGLMLGQSRRRWANIKPTLVQRPSGTVSRCWAWILKRMTQILAMWLVDITFSTNHMAKTWGTSN